MSPPLAQTQRAFATTIVSRLRDQGFQALWAGGCVRDLILEQVPADYDVATDATPEQVIALFGRKQTIPVGISFGVVRVRGSKGAGEVEVATFRSDGTYQDGRHPDSVIFSSPEQDAQRRDFSINGMFLDPLSGEIIDYVGGRADLEAGILRAIGDPHERFQEDKLRLLRAVRFAARFDFQLDPTTRAALVSMAGEIRVVAPERIGQELRRMLVHRSRARAVDQMAEVGLAREFVPAIVDLKGIALNTTTQPDGDLWDHTLRVLDLLPPDPTFTLAFAALLHHVGDVGGASSPRDQSGAVGSRTVARQITDSLCRALRLSNAERERVVWLVENHDSLRDARTLRASRLKRVLAMPGVDELLDLHEADALALRGESSEVEYCRDYLRNEPAGPINPPPLLTGHDLTQLGLTPGAHFARILNQIRDAQLDGLIQTKQDACSWLDQEGLISISKSI